MIDIFKIKNDLNTAFTKDILKKETAIIVCKI